MYESDGRRTMTQSEAILNYCKLCGSISQLEAASEIGCFRLSARIFDLQKQGHRFLHKSETRRNRFGNPVTFVRYILIDTGDGNA